MLFIFAHNSDNIPQVPVFNELSLSSNELLPLLSGLVKEARINFSLLVFHRHVAGEDVGIRGTLGHVRVPSAMVHHETFHQLGIQLRFVL